VANLGRAAVVAIMVFVVAASWGGTSGAQSPAPCPSTFSIQTVSSFAAFSHDITQLPADQRAAVDQVAARILTSFLPGCTPITLVLVEGYSDIVRDHPEWSDAQRFGREEQVSQERAVKVREYLENVVEAATLGLASRITFLPAVGYGRLDASPSKVEENRRVVITLGVRGIPQPQAKPNLDERAERALGLARQNGLAPMICALNLFKRRNAPDVSLFYVDAQKPITVVKGLPPVSLLWQGTECFGGIPRLCREQNYGALSFTEQLAFATNLVEDMKSTRFDPQRPDAEIVDRLKEITENAVMANRVINAHVRRLQTDGSVPDKARVQLNAQQAVGMRNPNDIHSCFFKE
jgi:outer membrane protein OmpA-like peptidoglycan-associated protein